MIGLFVTARWLCFCTETKTTPEEEVKRIRLDSGDKLVISCYKRNLSLPVMMIGVLYEKPYYLINASVHLVMVTDRNYMQTKTINSWSDFDRIVGRKQFRKWIFRGQSCSNWALESSLYRAFEEAQSIHQLSSGKKKSLNRIEHEKVMIDRFKCNAHLYLEHLPQPEDLLSWLSLMQHHGAPTRLLDFSFSPYVALFFALESGENDAAVYCVNHHAIRNDDDDYFGKNRLKVYSRILEPIKEKDDPCLFAFEPTFSNQRLLSQQGLFVATNTLNISHGKILDDYNIKDMDVIKVIIPAEKRLEGLRQLNKMNINASNIYPGLDGFCKSMRRQPVFGLEWQKRIGNEL